AKLALRLEAPQQFTLALRRPYWAGQGFRVRLNGQTVVAPGQEPAPDSFDQSGRSQYRRPPYDASSYVKLKRLWRSGDVVEVALPKTLHLEPLPDNPHRLSLMWGPLVLAGDLGPEPDGHRGEGERPAPPPVPVFVTADPVATWLKPVAGAPGHFRTDGVGREPDARGGVSDVDFQPFFRLHRRTYSTYWDLFTPAEWDRQKAAYAAEAERLRKLAAATVAYQQPGLSDPHRFFDLEYRLPEELVRGKSKVTVRFQAKQGSQIATVFGLRMIRGDAAR